MPGRERLFDLAHLGAGEVPDLGREAVERRGAQRERAEQLGVPVARDHLGRHRIGLEPEPLAGDRARPAGRWRRTCRPCPRAGRRGTSRAPARRGGAVAVELERPAGELPAERRRLGVDAVRAPDADRAAVLLGAADTIAQRARSTPASEQRAAVPDLQRERGVDDVRRREAVVHPAALRPELLGDGVDERRDVVVGRPLDLGDALGRRRVPRVARIAATSAAGTAPSSAQPSSAASSTSSQRASLPSSDQIRVISGRE